MPFGHQCEFQNFEQCVQKMSGKVDNPEAYCGALQRDTEEKCKRQSDHNADDNSFFGWARKNFGWKG